MNKTFKIIFTGKLQRGFEPDPVKKSLVSDFGMAINIAEKLVMAARPVVIKKNLDKKRAELICRHLQEIGMETIRVEENKQTSNKLQKETGTAVSSNKKEGSKTSEKTGDFPKPPLITPISGSNHTNPYSTPMADLSQKDPERRDFGEPHKVRAGRGWQWLINAYGMFKEYPWAWAAAFAVMFLLSGLLNLVPLFGSFVGYILLIVFNGGLMLGADAQREGHRFRFKYLFAGFSIRRNQLVLLGLIISLGFLACFIPMGLFMGKSIFIGSLATDITSAISASKIIISVLISLALSIPLYMGIWFSSSLVAINGYDAWPALKLSFQGCRINMASFLVYGLAIMIFFGVVAGILGVGAAVLVPMMMGTGGSFGLFLIFPLIGIILMLPATAIMGLSVYTGYQDIFYS